LGQQGCDLTDGDRFGCRVEIVRAYEQAIGAKIDTVVLAMNDSALESLALVHDWLTRLHRAREKKLL